VTVYGFPIAVTLIYFITHHPSSKYYCVHSDSPHLTLSLKKKKMLPLVFFDFEICDIFNVVASLPCYEMML